MRNLLLNIATVQKEDSFSIKMLGAVSNYLLIFSSEENSNIYDYILSDLSLI